MSSTYHIAVVPGPHWEVDTDNCETIFVQCAQVMRPSSSAFELFIDLSTNASGEAVDWRRVEGYVAVLRNSAGEDIAPIEGPFEDPTAAWDYVAETWSFRIPAGCLLESYLAPEHALAKVIG